MANKERKGKFSVSFEVPIVRQRFGRLTIRTNVKEAMRRIEETLPVECKGSLNEYAKLYMMNMAGVKIYPLVDRPEAKDRIHNEGKDTLDNDSK
jgi:hypothetical protein